MPEQVSLEFRLPFHELFLGDWQLSPCSEDLACRWTGAALELCFYAPWQIWSAVLPKYGVCYFGVSVL